MNLAPVCWLASATLEQRMACAEDGPAVFSQEEVSRAELLPARRAHQFLTGRWLLRQLLTEMHPGSQPGQWHFETPGDGPPQLRDVLAAPLQLSVSHSGDQVLVAVSPRPVGVDVEVPVPGRDRSALAQYVCPELHRLGQLVTMSADLLFYTLWTLKEAWLKRQGQGVTPGSLQALTVRPAREDDSVVAWSWTVDRWAMSMVGDADVLPRWSSRFRQEDRSSRLGCWAIDDQRLCVA